VAVYEGGDEGNIAGCGATEGNAGVGVGGREYGCLDAKFDEARRGWYFFLSFRSCFFLFPFVTVLGRVREVKAKAERIRGRQPEQDCMRG
jgi:hypothetical protein